MKHVYLMLIGAFLSFYSMSAQYVNITVPGTLDDAIAGMGTIKNLEVDGTIDSTDFMTLGGIFTLENLDLTGATVVNNRVPRETFFYKPFLLQVDLPPTVTSIGQYAFCGCSKLTSVLLPTSLKIIDRYAFASCSKLTQIVLPATLEKIGPEAFASCSLITQMNIPANVSYIGPCAFYGINVSGFTVDASNQYFITEDGVLFNKDKTILYAYPQNKIAFNYTIPSTVETLVYGAFDVIKNLSSITIPASVKEIYIRPFTNCLNLASIEVDASNLNYASSEGVLFNKGMTTLIKAPVKKAGTFEVPATVTYISEYAFHRNRIIDEIILPPTLDSLGAYAFAGCESLTSINLPDHLKKIHLGAFNGCTGIERMIVPLNIDSIPTDVFYSNSMLETLILPSHIKHFEYTNLSRCASLDSIWINAAVPPTVPEPYDFSNIDAAYITIYVPKGSLNAYSNHNFWKNFTIEEIDYTLDVSENSFSSEVAGRESELCILSNTEWTITTNQNWIHIDKEKGWFNGTIGVTIDANPGTPREGTITVSGLGIEPVIIPVSQSGLASGIDEMDEEAVKISLDQAKSYLRVENASGLKLALYSISGECLMIKDLQSDDETIDMQDMPSGIYLVKAGTYSVKLSK